VEPTEDPPSEASIPDTDDDAEDLGTAAQLLFEEGKVQAAALLIDARISRRDYIDLLMPLYEDGPGTTMYRVYLEVPRFLIERFTDEVIADIREALNEVLENDRIYVQAVELRAAIEPAGADWRATLEARMAPKATNQASVGPPMEKPLVEDRCQFRSVEELKVYRAFKRMRDRLPADDTLAIAPNPALVVPNINTSEPDLLILYRGRAGIVQVDGPQHRGRYANDDSRRRVYLHSGIAEVDHLPVEDTASDAELDEFVARFLKRLARA
jgi:hypothetical protein